MQKRREVLAVVRRAADDLIAAGNEIATWMLVLIKMDPELEGRMSTDDIRRQLHEIELIASRLEPEVAEAFNADVAPGDEIARIATERLLTERAKALGIPEWKLIAQLLSPAP
jgi:uncharacterized membrane protein YccC